MNYEPSPFDSIENAHEFFTLLVEIVIDTKKDIAQDAQNTAGRNEARRAEALRLAVYNLEKLEMHVTKSRRILNDLRSIRRLLLEERAARPAGLPVARQSAIAKPAVPVAPFAVTLSSHVTRPDARPQGAAAA